MAITVEEVRESLLAEKWQETLRLAAAALAERKWEPGDEAFLHYARSHSLNNLGQYSEAMPSGQMAVHLAEATENWDLLGLALLNLAFSQGKMPNGAILAVSTARRYFEFVGRYKELGKQKYLTAMRNLAYYLYSAGDAEAALQQYIAARNAALKRRNADEADKCRRSAVAIALTLRRLDEAEDMIKQGEDYIAQHTDKRDIVASHLIDQATLHELKGRYRKANGKALEAYVQAKDIPSLAALALQILHRVAKTRNMPRSAISAGVTAKYYADVAERYDVIGSLSISLKQIGLVHRDALQDFMGDAGSSDR